MQLPIAQSIAIESLQMELLRTAELRLSGALRTATALEELLRQIAVVHEHIVAKKYASFKVDVRSLSFVNSSAIGVFVKWISLADKAHYKLVFVTERSITWHRLSFSVLKSLSPHTVEIQDGQVSARGTT
jgi:hypothetical protein